VAAISTGQTPEYKQDTHPRPHRTPKTASWPAGSGSRAVPATGACSKLHSRPCSLFWRWTASGGSTWQLLLRGRPRLRRH